MAKVKRSIRTSVPALVFISHNKADKNVARSLAQALIDQGISVWFDEWKLKPGDSIIGGIEDGLAAADMIVVVWSKNAAKSKWVKAEVRASLYRRITDEGVRVVPVLLDNTPLPVLLADSLGLRLSTPKDVLQVAAKLGGNATPMELGRRLQERFFEVLNEIGGGVDPMQYRFCPMCGSPKLEGWQQTDYARDDNYAGICCKKCGWDTGGEV